MLDDLYEAKFYRAEGSVVILWQETDSGLKVGLDEKVGLVTSKGDLLRLYVGITVGVGVVTVFGLYWRGKFMLLPL